MIPDKQSFDSSFEVFLADTPESKQIHYNLRYQVYCDEMGFEDKDAFPEQMESDDWDEHAVSFIVRHKSSGHWLGGLRLVFNKNDTFPFEQLTKPYQHIKQTQRQVSVEMSRLCVIKEARRFSSKLLAPYDLPNQEFAEETDKVKVLYDYKNQTGNIMWGLIRAAALYSAKRNLEHWYFIVTPALASFLRRKGFQMLQIGDPCEHRGLRTPYKLSVASTLALPLWRHDYKRHYSTYSGLEEEAPYQTKFVVSI